ncbi:MAG: hypothetical protein JNM27_00765 [Leptospirales bacterium]|nr:hypothetical protein [Leptospirales bacterium]
MANTTTFLELLKEQEALARGANLNEKVHHAIYKTIKMNSTVEAVRNNHLYHVGVNVPDVLHLTKKDVINVLTRLSSERLIAQIFLFSYEPGQGRPGFTPCFITLPPEDKQSIGQLFDEGVLLSARAIESYVDSLPPVTSDMIWADLEKDLAMEGVPMPADLPASIVDVFSGVHAASFEVVPSPEMIQTTLGEIQDFLARRGRLVHVLDYGFMPVREREVLDRVESAGDFLLSKVIPKYKSRGSLKAELEQVQLEEAAYYLNENAPRTADFLARRANLLKKAILSDPGRKGGVRYPGALAVETLLLVEPFSRQKYAEQWKAEIATIHAQFKERLRRDTTSWSELLVFMDDKEILSFPTEAWKRISDDKDILHHTWERSGRTVHVFLRKDADVFRSLVIGMADIPISEHWKILAMKFLLDRYETLFSSLFHDEEFVRNYGKLLRKAYVDYIPWYFRVFLWLGLSWFQDRSFQIAKQKISIEQRSLGSGNQQRAAELQQARETEKRQMMSRIQEVSAANQIIDALDKFYQTDMWIPTVAEVQANLTDMEAGAFRDAINRGRFQIVREGKAEKADRDLLIYPMNHEWRVRAARLRRALDRIAAKYPAAMQSDEAINMHSRSALLQKYLSRKEKELPVSESEDPYQRFEKALKTSQKETAQKEATPLIEDELEV